MKYKKLFFCTIATFIFACSVDNDSVKFDVKIYPASTYTIDKETKTFFPLHKDTIVHNSSLTMETKDLNEVRLSNYKFKSNGIKSDYLNNNSLLFPTDMLKNEICYSINGRSITSESKLSQTKTVLALWNQQMGFPRDEIITKDTARILSSLQQSTLIEEILYSLDSIENAVAFIKFSGRSETNGLGTSQVSGALEYHVKDNYFQLIDLERVTILSKSKQMRKDSILDLSSSADTIYLKETSRISKL